MSVDVTNTGSLVGKEVVQFYVSDKESSVIRPEKELKGFAKLDLKPGETKTATFKLNKRSFAYFNTQIHDWHVETGTFTVMIGKSSRDIVLKEELEVISTTKLPVYYTTDTTFGDLMKDEKAASVVKELLSNSMFGNDESNGDAASEAISKDMMMAMMQYMPLRGVLSFSEDGSMGMKELQALVDKLNKEA